MNEIARTEDAPTPMEAAPVESAGALTPMQMIDRALSTGAGVETIEKLMELQERWEANMGRKAFDHAIAAAKAEIPPIVKNRRVDYTTSKGRTTYQHEDLAEIARTVDPILSRHGLSYRYRTAQDGQAVTVTCILSHKDGYSEETTLSSGADQSGSKNAIQAVGSAATYLQRYTLKMALGLAAAADDDGKAAGQAEAPATITDAQAQELRDLLAKAGRDEARFCQYGGIERLEDMAAHNLDQAKRLILQAMKQPAKDGA